MKAESLFIRDGYVIDPATGLDCKADLLVENGRIVEIVEPGKAGHKADHHLDATGLIVAPGFVDIHVHLREPGQTHKETIATGTAAAAAGGFTAVCPMPNTTPVNDSVEITEWMQASERGAVVNVFPIGAATVGSMGERLTNYEALKRAGIVAVTDDGKPILDEKIMRLALETSARSGLPVIQHAEDTKITAGCSMHLGSTSFRLGLRGMPAEAESSIVERDIRLAREVGGHLHVAHLSTALALEAVRRAKRLAKGQFKVTCEVTPHHFVLTHRDIHNYDANFKMNPPLRSREDVEAILVGLEDGTVDCIATDHAPHAKYEKNQEFERAPFGITGFESALGLAITALHQQRGMSLKRIIQLMSCNPAHEMGLKGRGQLKPGSPADITIFDPNQRWTFRAEGSLSKSKNTPFDGVKLQGRVVHTIVNGRVVYSTPTATRGSRAST